MGQGISIEGYATPAINMEVYNNTITNCASDGIAVQSTFANGRYSNNIHDNNVFNNEGYQLLIQYNIATHNNNYSNNHLIDPTPSAAVRIYGAASYSVSDFNNLVTGYNDIISGNDAILKWVTSNGILTTSTTYDVRIEYNTTSIPVTVTLDQNYRDIINNSDHSQYVLQPYSSVILVKHTAFQSTSTRKASAYHKKELVHHKKVLKY